MPENSSPHPGGFDLCAAFSAVPPGPGTSPGPQAQDWSAHGPEVAVAPCTEAAWPVTVPLPGGAVAAGVRASAPRELLEWFGALGHQLFFSEEFHRDEVSGRTLRVRRRPVPSAGAAYPVQLHLRLGPWRLAYHQEHDAVHDLTCAFAHPADFSASSQRQARLTFTVLPGRSFSRYRHRAWTLWIADVAYAVEGARHVMGHAPAIAPVREIGPSELARQAALPARAFWPTPHPELAIQGLDVGRAVGGLLRLPALRPLPHRRSIPLKRLTANTEPGPPPRPGRRPPAQQQLLAPEHCSEQVWLATWPHVRLFTVPATEDPLLLRRQLVDVHRRAARLTYAEAKAGRQVRPISGFTDVPDRRDRCLHALVLETSTKTGEPR